MTQPIAPPVAADDAALPRQQGRDPGRPAAAAATARGRPQRPGSASSTPHRPGLAARPLDPRRGAADRRRADGPRAAQPAHGARHRRRPARAGRRPPLFAGDRHFARCWRSGRAGRQHLRLRHRRQPFLEGAGGQAAPLAAAALGLAERRLPRLRLPPRPAGDAAARRRCSASGSMPTPRRSMRDRSSSFATTPPRATKARAAPSRPHAAPLRWPWAAYAPSARTRGGPTSLPACMPPASRGSCSWAATTAGPWPTR